MDTESVGGEEEAAVRQGTRKHPFFRRSESTLCLGCPQPDPFALPMIEALPLADQPHLLQPYARREELFGAPRQPITIQPSGNHPPGSTIPLKFIPGMLRTVLDPLKGDWDDTRTFGSRPVNYFRNLKTF